MSPSEEDKKQRCHLSNYSSLKKDKIGFDGMERNVELSYSKSRRKKVANPDLSLDGCLSPKIFLSHLVRCNRPQ